MSAPGVKARCSHCGKSATEVEHLFGSTIRGSSAYICNECLLTYYEIYVQRQQDMQRIEEGRYHVAERLTTALQAFVADHQSGQIVVGGDRRPEVALFRRDRLTIDQIKTLLEQTPHEGVAGEPVPDLVAHVAGFLRSGGEAAEGQGYLTRGVALVWIIRPRARRVEVWQPVAQGAVPSSRELTMADALDGLDVLTGFRYAISDLFEGIW